MAQIAKVVASGRSGRTNGDYTLGSNSELQIGELGKRKLTSRNQIGGTRSGTGV